MPTLPPPIANPTDPPAVSPADMAEFVALLQSASARQLFTAEAIATVNIGAGADVEASAEYLDAIRAEQARRADQTHADQTHADQTHADQTHADQTHADQVRAGSG